MLYHNRDFRTIIGSCQRLIKKVVIDKAHCVKQWGDKFRLEYSRLDFVRTLTSKDCPILATTATLETNFYGDAASAIQFNLNKTFEINLGND